MAVQWIRRIRGPGSLKVTNGWSHFHYIHISITFKYFTTFVFITNSFPTLYLAFLQQILFQTCDNYLTKPRILKDFKKYTPIYIYIYIHQCPGFLYLQGGFELIHLRFKYQSDSNAARIENYSIRHTSVTGGQYIRITRALKKLPMLGSHPPEILL